MSTWTKVAFLVAFLSSVSSVSSFGFAQDAVQGNAPPRRSPGHLPCTGCNVRSAQPDIEKNAPWLLEEWRKKGLEPNVPETEDENPPAFTARDWAGEGGEVAPLRKAQQMRMENGEP